MLITAIRDYIQLQGRANLQDVARHFRLSTSAVEPMLNFWVKKGLIKLIKRDLLTCAGKQCSTCISCNLDAYASYVWIE
ncbi:MULTISPECIES: FeoC-like transcriptional regulator [Gilliamella]|uniref:LuxR family transcriptional regulator n=1 Tax=Gilliamella apis TaxID=1970738 RepID=A0A2V4DVZ6_9GAMM|nr:MULTISPECIES: FeoC-like transcriptional regulator [Gilliamella]MBI0006538.1 FeoC-like transcriptional regulator [Gilliamella sp. W8126]MBI0103379.1 FeoC-like transcriptional regulator [Gilliamella sp. W8145]PXY91679.1 LuxR family transcriptional regulator [Gilliamella apis]WLS93321.1 FeoC-like transcriptional regulator [Gilliamella apis]